MAINCRGIWKTEEKKKGRGDGGGGGRGGCGGGKDKKRVFVTVARRRETLGKKTIQGKKEFRWDHRKRAKTNCRGSGRKEKKKPPESRQEGGKDSIGGA